MCDKHTIIIWSKQRRPFYHHKIKNANYEDSALTGKTKIYMNWMSSRKFEDWKLEHRKLQQISLMFLYNFFHFYFPLVCCSTLIYLYFEYQTLGLSYLLKKTTFMNWLSCLLLYGPTLFFLCIRFNNVLCFFFRFYILSDYTKVKFHFHIKHLSNSTSPLVAFILIICMVVDFSLMHILHNKYYDNLILLLF